MISNQVASSSAVGITSAPVAYEMEAYDLLPPVLRAALAESAQKWFSLDVHRMLQDRLAWGLPWDDAVAGTLRQMRAGERTEINRSGHLGAIVSIQRPEYGALRTRRRRR